MNNESLRTTVPSPMVSRSVHTGTCREKMTTPRPIFAPEGLQIEHVERRADEQDQRVQRMSVLTTQKRT